MIIDYGIILEEKILYCSNDNKFTAFETVIFIEKMIIRINPKYTWRVNSIHLKSSQIGDEYMVINHIVAEDNQNLFYCVINDFKPGSRKIFHMLEEFFDKVNDYYPNIDLLKQASEMPPFTDLIESITDDLWNKYKDGLKEEPTQETPTCITNRLLYCGISFHGLALISHLYEKTLLNYLDKEINEENIDLYNSGLSAHLATIVMNTEIRTKMSIKEIHLYDLEEEACKKIIFFGHINGFFIDFFASGEYNKIKRVFKQVKHRLSKEKILYKKFIGYLQPYKYLQKYFEEIGDEFENL